MKEKKRLMLLRIDELKNELKNPKYPYLTIPWQFENPIVDNVQYKKAFHLPGILSFFFVMIL